VIEEGRRLGRKVTADESAGPRGVRRGQRTGRGRGDTHRKINKYINERKVKSTGHEG